MDLSALPPAGNRPPADPPQSAAAHVADGATETRPETARPVEAAEAPTNPAPIPGLGIPPLDTFEVGDNDDVPVPPEPPRPAQALVAAELPETSNNRSSVEASEDQSASETQVVHQIYNGTPLDPANPSVDIRR